MTQDNPQAFPGPVNTPGMTLRDYFAGQALAGLLGNDLDGPPGKGVAGHTDHFATLSYQYADALLAARQSNDMEGETSRG
jgi:hypothetical protein